MSTSRSDHPPLVAVYWDDHSGSAPDWHDSIEPADIKVEPYPMVTVGWLVKDIPAGIVVACEMDSPSSYRGSVTILRPFVIAVRVLRKGSLWRRPPTQLDNPTLNP